MRLNVLLLSAAAMALTPTIAWAQLNPAPGNGQYNGQGYNHSNSGNAYGQPGDTCQNIIAAGGSSPGNAGSSPGGGSPFDFAVTKSGAQYAGSSVNNSRNTASVSQYDVACANQPQL